MATKLTAQLKCAMFQNSTVPRGARLAGWAALTHALALAAPVKRPSCVFEQHIGGNRRQERLWSVFDRRYWPGDTLGERDHLGDPMPKFIGARPDDLEDLMDGLIEANNRMRDDGLDPVLQAAATAFAPRRRGSAFRLPAFACRHYDRSPVFCGAPPGPIHPAGDPAGARRARASSG
jgi:hypothetical protein